MYLWLWITVVAAGSVGQFVDALAGMGFGAFTSSIMLASGISPAIVVGTVSLAKVGSGLISGLSHWRFGNVRRSWVVPLAISGVAGGVLAATLIAHLPETASRLLVPAILIVMAALILRRFLSRSAGLPRVAGASQDMALAIPQGRLHKARLTLANVPSSLWLGGIGFLGGILQGLSGAFGPFATSSVMLVKKEHPRFAIGTVNFVEFFVAAAVSVALFSQLDWHAFQWELPLALMAGSILTAPLGAYLSRRLPARLLGAAVGAVLMSINMWIIFRAIARPL